MPNPDQPQFSFSTEKELPQTIDIANGRLTLYPHAFSAPLADYYLAHLIKSIDWQQDYLKIHGNSIAIPRLQAWYGDSHSHYQYSGLKLAPLAWTKDLLEIKQRVESLCQCQFNSVLLNYYRDGKDSVAWHSDNEVELGPRPIIASVSFGVTRRFVLKHKHNKTLKKINCPLHHGSLIVMGDTVQKYWQHQVPKEPDITQTRINLTFRNILH